MIKNFLPNQGNQSVGYIGSNSNPMSPQVSRFGAINNQVIGTQNPTGSNPMSPSFEDFMEWLKRMSNGNTGIFQGPRRENGLNLPGNQPGMSYLL